MKKTLTIALLAITTIVSAQIRFIDKEFTTISLAIDPSASNKEGGLHLSGEIQLISNWKYVKANIQIFDALEGGYLDYTGGFGVNLTSGYFDETRFYTGVRLGFIKRGYKDEQSYTYPLAGIEGGFDYQLSDSFFIGLRATGDYRQDFQYSGAEPSMRYSGFVRLGFKL